MRNVIRSERFQVLRELGSGGVGVVYEARDPRTQERLALKTLHFVDGESLYRFKREFRLLADIRHENLARLGELVCEEGTWFFTMELVDGVPFREYVRPRGQLDVARLRAALRQLASALLTLHRGERVHRDVKDSNALVDRSGRVVLLDFGLTEPLTTPGGITPGRRGPLGTFAYVAPERVQGGAPPEPPEDWYAFGVMLYGALTGELPFSGEPAEIFARKTQGEAPDPAARTPGLPQDLRALCRQLLSREPAERPTGPQVLEALRGASGGRGAPPPALDADGPDAEIFVGRALQLELLEQARARCGQGEAASVLIIGEPGVGKTALCRHFLRTASSAKQRLTLAGRCYQQESVPLKAVDEVVDALSHYLLTLPEPECARVLPSSIHVLARAFPVLCRVPVVARCATGASFFLGDDEQRARTFDALRALLANVAEHTELVVLVDDLQWADADSLRMLNEILRARDAPRMLLLATIRDDALAEGSGWSPPPGLLERFTQLRLRGLEEEDAQTLLRRLLQRDAPRALIDELLKDGRGHPLFLAEMARYQRQFGGEGTLTLLREMIWRRVDALDEATRRVLYVIAVAGIPLSPAHIASGAELPTAAVVGRIRQLRADQLVSVLDTEQGVAVRPYHDRVREAILQGLGERRLEIDLRLGRAYLERVQQGGEAELFPAVAHLGRAAHLLDEEERGCLIDLEIEASQRCLASVAYETALEHARRAVARLPEGAWERDYARALKVARAHIDALYRGGRAEDAQAEYARTLARLRSRRDATDLHTQRIARDTANGRLDEALETARRGLAAVGVRLARRGSPAGVLREIAALRWALWRHGSCPLSELPELTEEPKRLANELLMASAPAAFFTDSELMTQILLRMARMAVRDGVTEVSAYGFMGYGAVLAGAFNDGASANEFADLAFELNERFGNDALASKLLFVAGLYVRPWLRPFSESLELFRRGVEAGRAHGDSAYECYNAYGLGHIAWLQQTDLGAVETHCRDFLSQPQYREDADMAATTRGRLAACVALHEGQAAAQACAATETHGTEEPGEQPKTPVASCCVPLYRGVVSYAFGELDTAEAQLELAADRAQAQFGIPTLADLAMYRALVASALTLSRRERRGARRRRCRVTVARLQRWASQCPDNFAARYRIAAGALRDACGRHSEAQDLYIRGAERAAQAREHGLQGVALEALSRSYRAQGNTRDAGRFAEQAASAFERYGADAKAAQLRTRWEGTCHGYLSRT